MLRGAGAAFGRASGGSPTLWRTSTMSRRAFPVWLAALLAPLGAVPARADLPDYLKRPEPAYAWRLKEKVSHPQGTVYDLELVSQTWQDITWKHQLQVYQPEGVA